MRRLLVLGLALSLVPAVAMAQERILSARGAVDVVVWRDSAAQSEGVKLITAGVHKTNPGLVVPLVACIVPSGTLAVITDHGVFSSTVRVTSGTSAGCGGVLSNDFIEPRR